MHGNSSEFSLTRLRGIIAACPLSGLNEMHSGTLRNDDALCMVIVLVLAISSDNTMGGALVLFKTMENSDFLHEGTSRRLQTVPKPPSD